MQHTRYIIAQGFNDKEPDEETGIDYLPQSSLPIAISYGVTSATGQDITALAIVQQKCFNSDNANSGN